MLDTLKEWLSPFAHIPTELTFNLSLLIFLIVLGCLFLWIHFFYRAAKILLLLFSFTLFCCCFSFVPSFLLNHLLSHQDAVWQEKFLKDEKHPVAIPLPTCTKQAQAIVVLGGGLRPEGYLSTSSMERVMGSVDFLHQAQKEGQTFQKILFSGGKTQKRSPLSEAFVMKKQALQSNSKSFEKMKIMTEEDSKNTKENAKNSKNILNPLHVNKIILITSNYHMPRAKKIFEQNQFVVCPIAISSSLFVDFKIFSINNILLTNFLLHEYLGILDQT